MLLSLLLILAQSAVQGPTVIASYIPERVHDSDRKRFTDFEAMLADLARADVVFVGEQHDDPNTHRLEVAILEGLARRRGNVVLALEMFERDVQGLVSEYAAGTTPEDEFLKGSRPWPRYATDYRPLVEFARSKGWPIVASNVPRRLASAVAKTGLAALKTSDGDPALYAAEQRCPDDDYFDRFAETMTAHPIAGTEKMTPAEQRGMVQRFYESQCLKDETMAESVVRARERGSPLVVHVNGSFHSDFGDGAAERVRRRLPRARVVIVSILPVDNLDAINPTKQDRKRAEYLVFTVPTAAGDPPRHMP